MAVGAEPQFAYVDKALVGESEKRVKPGQQPLADRLTFRVYAWLLSGELLLDSHSEEQELTTVGNIAAAVSLKKCIPYQRVRLLFNGRVLDNRTPLAELRCEFGTPGNVDLQVSFLPPQRPLDPDMLQFTRHPFAHDFIDDDTSEGSQGGRRTWTSNDENTSENSQGSRHASASGDSLKFEQNL